MQIENEVIWITGASSGIGEALATEAYKQGAFLVLSGRNKDKLEEMKKLFPDGENRIQVLPLDLSRHEELTVKTEEVMKRWGRLDILINNGGVSQRSLLVETSSEVIQHIINVNFLGAAILSREAANIMTKQKSGYILLISSVAGKFSTPYRTIYSASKMALQGLCDGLRAELWKYNIKVSLVVPGFVKTNISLNALEGSGNSHGVMDPNQAAGISSEAAASIILRGIVKEKREIYLGMVTKTRIAMFLSRFFPGVLAKMLRTAKVT